MKPIIVEIPALAIIPPRSGKSKTGSDYSIGAKQVADFHNSGRHVIAGEVMVPDSGPYRPGLYLLGGPCFAPGEYGVKFVDRGLQLVPIEDALKAIQSFMASAK